MYREEGTDARVWYCLAHADCRAANKSAFCTVRVTSACSKHLQLAHGLLGKKTHQRLAKQEEEREARKAKDADKNLMVKTGRAPRYYMLDFVRSFVVREFVPFIFAEKASVKDWLTRNGTWAHSKCFSTYTVEFALPHTKRLNIIYTHTHTLSP